MQARYTIGEIHDVLVTPLKRIPDERGAVYHMLKETDTHFTRFGEIYFSVVHPGAIKAWHLHRLMSLNYAVPFGKIKLVVFDDRHDSPTKGNLDEIFLGTDSYNLVTIPPGVWNGFKGLGCSDAIVANCATITHDTNEIIRDDPFTERIGYDWEIKHQ